MYRIGPPEVLVSDNEFISQEVQRMCRAFNVQHEPTPTYNPRSNGKIERQFRTIKQLLQSMTRGLNQENWPRWIGAITFAINANINRMTGFTPFYLMFGCEPSIPLHTIVGLPQPEALEPQDFVKTHMLAMTRDLLRVNENYNAYYRRTATTYRAKSLIGDPSHLNKRVWATSPYRKKGTSGALSAMWSGPWRVVRFSPPPY